MLEDFAGKQPSATAFKLGLLEGKLSALESIEIMLRSHVSGFQSHPVARESLSRMRHNVNESIRALKTELKGLVPNGQ